MRKLASLFFIFMPIIGYGMTEDWGFNWGVIDKACRSNEPVMISSSALKNTNVRSGVGRYAFREIINTSEANLTLFPSSSVANGQADYTVASATYSIVLASRTTANVVGGSWKTYSQGAIFGVWGSCGNAGGAGGSEHW